MLMVWVRFSKMLTSLKFAEDKVLVFVIFRENAKWCNSNKSNRNPNPNFQNRLIR